MASPQLENGFTKIANELLEALVLLHLPPNEWQILLCIIRKTYGFNKKVDKIANFQIMKETELGKEVVSRGLKSLFDRNIIKRSKKIVGINKDYDTWKLAFPSTKKLAKSSTSGEKKLAKSSTELAKSSTFVDEIANGAKLLNKKETIQKKEVIDIYKNTNKKEPSGFEKAEEIWKEILGIIQPSMHSSIFKFYFAGTRGVGLNGNKLMVGMTRKDQVESLKNVRGLIDRASSQLGFSVKFSVRRDIEVPP